MKLHYNFNDIYVSGAESFHVKENDFVYEVSEEGNYNKLKAKYYKEALQAAVYKNMSEYADILVGDRDECK